MKFFLTVILLYCFVGQAFSQNYFFYSYSDSPWTFNRSNSDGSSPIVVYTPPYGTVTSSTADASINKVYYYDNSTNSADTQSEIFQSDYDGSNTNTLLTLSKTASSGSTISSIAAGNGYLFYAYLQSPYSLRRMNSDGTGDTQIYLNPNYGTVNAVAVDVANNYLYFYEYKYDNTNSRIVRTDLDGNNLTTVFTTTASINCLTAGDGYFFFAPSENPWTFRRRNSDGSNEQVIYTPPAGEVECCSYNEALNKIYFYDNNPKAIYISDIDGSNRVALDSGFTQGIASLASPKANEVLPVELISFTSMLYGNNVRLNWKTATEVNNYGFDIERKQLGNKQYAVGNDIWEKIGFVKGSGNSNSPKSYSFVDACPFGDNPVSGDVEYRLKQIDNDGQFVYSKTVEATSLPTQFKLAQNYPDPFNPTTSIQYAIPKAEHVTLKVYDELGKEVKTLVDENKAAGQYNVQFNGSGLASGIFYYRITVGEFTEVKKLMLLK